MNLLARRMLIPVLAALVCGTIKAGEETVKLRDDKSRNTVMAGCITCHSLDYITMNASIMDRGKWEKTVTKMIDVYKAPISKENAAVIVEYLSTHYVAAR